MWPYPQTVTVVFPSAHLGCPMYHPPFSRAILGPCAPRMNLKSESDGSEGSDDLMNLKRQSEQVRGNWKKQLTLPNQTASAHFHLLFHLHFPRNPLVSGYTASPKPHHINQRQQVESVPNISTVHSKRTLKRTFNSNISNAHSKRATQTSQTYTQRTHYGEG